MYILIWMADGAQGERVDVNPCLTWMCCIFAVYFALQSILSIRVPHQEPSGGNLHTEPAVCVYFSSSLSLLPVRIMDIWRLHSAE